MKKFIFITLALVILVLLWRNVDIFTQVIKTTTDLFGKTFKAVTSADNFK